MYIISYYIITTEYSCNKHTSKMKMIETFKVNRLCDNLIGEKKTKEYNKFNKQVYKMFLSHINIAKTSSAKKQQK